MRFYPATSPAAASPLARFLPPLPSGMAAAWLAENVPPGSWVLDPLGASPALVLELAQAGYRVLAACNNPILNFMIETLSGAPGTADFQSALAELAIARRGDERLEHHVRELYLTDCDSCGEPVEAQAFLWRRGDAHPYARLYRCPRCGDPAPKERPVIQADLDRLSAMGGDRMQRARAIQRVVMSDSEPREDVEAALENYLARPLYVLFTLLNRSEGLALSPERRRLVQALLLNTFDAGSALWPWPGGRARPRQLTIPPQFRENNLWLALEESAAPWAAASWATDVRTSARPAIPVTRWPELPEAGPGGLGGICLFRGRVKALMPVPPEIGPRALVTVFPRPNQAFWTLSALWAGWLWGPEAALPLRNVLDRRRYDWNWHTTAVHSALSAAGAGLPAGTPFFGLLPELAPGFLSAVVAAAQAGGFDLQGLALPGGLPLHGGQEIAQGLWLPTPGPASAARGRTGALQTRTKSGPEHLPATAGRSSAGQDVAVREGMREDLLRRGEPAPYLTVYAAGLQALARSGCILRSSSGIPGDLLSGVQAGLARAFADRGFLRLYGGRQQTGPAEEERGWWWLADTPRPPPSDAANLPLADLVEMEVVRYMQRHPAFRMLALDEYLCAHFTGLLTPAGELTRACVESYGEEVPGQAGQWRLRAGETPAARKTDLAELRAALQDAGQQMGFTVSEHANRIIWSRSGGETWRYYLLASSIISRYVYLPPAAPSEQTVLVLPGSRARLLNLKLRRDPRLADAAHGWRLVKFRLLRSLAARGGLTLAQWAGLLEEDPFKDDATQMSLFA